MNKILIFFIVSSFVFILSLIVLCISPIINNTKINTYEWRFSDWRTLNCKLYEDMEDYDEIYINYFFSTKRTKNLCRRKKAMYDLEYAVLIINLFFGFLCSNLSLFQYLNIGRKISKRMSLIGIIFGFCSFVLTLVYISFNGYIFINDPAYDGAILKKFPNGASYKYSGGKYITAYEGDYGEEDGKFIRYKDLGDKQYNYDSKYFKNYMKSSNNCKEEYIHYFNINNYITGCDYIFSSPVLNMENKNLYNKWITSLIFVVFVLLGNLLIFVFSMMIYVSKKSGNDDDNTIDINQ